MGEFLSQATDSSASEGEFYTWKFPGSPLRIQVALDVVERLQREVVEAARATDGPGTEIGGLLLGSAAPSKGGVEIRGYQPLRCENAPDGRFAFSTPADLERLDEAISAPRDGLTVVGTYRSHLRNGLGLEDRDLTVCQIWFSEPTNVFLLIKPSTNGSCEAGFFFWDQGYIHSSFSFLEFPFDAGLLRGMTALEHAPEASPPAPLVESTSEPAPAVAMPVAGDAAAPVAAPSRAGPRIGLWWAVAAVLAVALFLGIRFDLFQRLAATRATEDSGAQVSVLGLQVVTRGGDLVVSWNRNSPAIKTARSGVLLIRDGDQAAQEIPLDASQLRSGSVLYGPVSDRVQFRLDVNGDQKVSELVLAIIRGRTRPEQAAEKAAENPARVERPPVVPPPTRSQPAQVAAFEPKATPSPKPPPDNSGIISRAVRTFVPPSQSAPREQAPRTIYVEPPEVRGATPMGSASPLAMAPAVRIPEPPPAPVRETPSQAKPEAPPAAVQPAPAQPAPAQQVPAQTASAQLAPAPAREPESKRAGASYVQPRPLRQSPPSVPPQLLRALIVKDTQVEVKAYVDATGKVTRAEVLSGVTHRLLINAVTEAAQRWTFAPAQMDGKPVAAEARIIFLFRVPPSQLRD